MHIYRYHCIILVGQAPRTYSVMFLSSCLVGMQGSLNKEELQEINMWCLCWLGECFVGMSTWWLFVDFRWSFLLICYQLAGETPQVVTTYSEKASMLMLYVSWHSNHVDFDVYPTRRVILSRCVFDVVPTTALMAWLLVLIPVSLKLNMMNSSFYMHVPSVG